MTAAWVEDLLAWYGENARDLPWRTTEDPYAIWVAEIMLQQTRVETVLPYYRHWMARFPTVESLAEAPPEEVLRLWEGLGYYRRAHNLHRSARIVAENHGGQFPAASEELRRLPGVGRYTAAAIAAMAFGQPTVALDGNLRRVLSRLVKLENDPRSPEGERTLARLASAALPDHQASAFNQALMDLGALVCTPKAPTCDRCPLADHCQALRQGVQEQLPVRAARAETPLRQMVAGVILHRGKTLIGRRAAGGLLGGLWGYPHGELEPDESPTRGLRRIMREEFGLQLTEAEALLPLAHAYTHFRVELHPFLCSIKGRRAKNGRFRELSWVAPNELDQHPMGKLDRKLSALLQERRRSLTP